MKRMQLTELFADIKASLASFISILMFVALGMGIFLGISWAGPALHTASDKIFTEGNFHNFQIQFPYGLSEDDLKELSGIEGVTQIEAECQSFQTLRRGEERLTFKVQSLGQDIDVPVMVEGTLPTKTDEIAIHRESAHDLGISVGDTITFVRDAKTTTQSDGSQTEPQLKSETFTVTALMDTADYIAKAGATYGFSNSPSGAVNALAWVADDAFNAAAYQDNYPIVNVRTSELDGLSTFGDAYDEGSKKIEERISALGTKLAQARFDDLHGGATKQLEEAEKKLADGKDQIAKGEKEVKEGETKLAEARAELDRAVASGTAELASALKALEDGEARKVDAEAQVAQGRSSLDSAKKKLAEVDETKAEAKATAQEMEAYKKEQDAALAAGEITLNQYNRRLDEFGTKMNARTKKAADGSGMVIPAVDFSNFSEVIDLLNTNADATESMIITVDGEKMTIAEARVRVREFEQELADAQAQLDASEAELAAGWQQYHAGQAELETKRAEGEQEIAEGSAKIQDAKKQLADAKAEVAENEPKVEGARELVAQIKKYDWSVLPRSFNAGVGEVTTFTSVTGSLSTSMALLFIIVGLLVSYFAMNRIVHEKTAFIGTKKALGFRTKEITTSLLWYSGIAVLLGAIIGALIAFFAVEGVLDYVFGNMFCFGPYPAHLDLVLFAIMAAIELALVLGATYLACRGILKKNAVELLQGRQVSTATEHFYEKWGIWDKISLFTKVIVGNCVNDKRRLFSTIVGVAGSTALIVTAITLSNDIMKSYDRHYDHVFGFNHIAYVDNSVEGAASEVEKALKDEGATTARVFRKGYRMEEPGGGSAPIRIVVPFDDAAFSELYHVNPVKGAGFDPTAEGIWVSQAYGVHTGAKVGDIIVIDSGEGTKHEVPIAGFYEFWLSYHEAVMGSSYFQKEFGEVTPNCVLAHNEGDLATARAAIMQVEGADTLVDDAKAQYSNFDTFSSVSTTVVAIYLALATLMAVVVLLNLDTMFIDEKKRELIVLMINGYSVKDAKHYVSYDSVVLTALGIIAGIVLGCIMGSATVASIEPSTGVFVKGVDSMAVIAGIVGSAILAFVMGKIAVRRIPKFKLTDLNKV